MPLCSPRPLPHGALPWRNRHVRRIVIHRYAAKTIQYGPGFHEAVMPDWVTELPEDQRAALEPAHFYDRDAISENGVTRSWDDYDRPDYPYGD